MAEILSVAIFEPLEGQEADALSTLRELMAALAVKHYSRDTLHRSAKEPRHYLLLRTWRSEDARRSAHEDPEIQKFWARLGNEIRIVTIYEVLEDVT
jgi:quinol monooxygenase YgiN